MPDDFCDRRRAEQQHTRAVAANRYEQLVQPTLEDAVKQVADAVNALLAVAGVQPPTRKISAAEFLDNPAARREHYVQ